MARTATPKEAPTAAEEAAILEAASDAAHDDDVPTVTATGGSTFVADEGRVAAIVAAIGTTQGTWVTDPTPYDTQGTAGTAGYNYRAAVAAACDLTPQWFSTKVLKGRTSERYYFAMTHRAKPTKDRTKNKV